MKTLIVALALTLSSAAMADGFKCEQAEYGVNIQVYNQTNPNSGNRNAAVMVFSDASVSYGRKTIASFSSNKRTLGQTGTSYMAVVDLRVSESNRSGENFLGTKLGQLKEIYVDVAHNYNYPVRAGTLVDGTVTLVKRNGATKTLEITCERYLKN